MRRKLVQMGRHTLMAAIPSKWIKRHQLCKGDEIDFTEVDNQLVLTSTAEIYERKTEITISSPKIEVIWRKIQPTYTSGYDEVRINFQDKKTLPLIEDSINGLIGFEIVETNEGYVIVKSVSKNIDEEFSTILRRTFLVYQQIGNITQQVFTTKSKKRINEIRPLELTINKYTMFLKRVINRTGYKYPHYMYLIVSFLELASNHYEYIRKYFELNPNTPIDTSSKEDAIKLNNLITKVNDLYFNYTEEKFTWIAEEQPHFFWFKKIKDSEIKYNFKSIAEYLVQIARQIGALNNKKEGDE